MSLAKKTLFRGRERRGYYFKGCKNNSKSTLQSLIATRGLRTSCSLILNYGDSFNQLQMISVNMLCSISQAGFASEHGNASETPPHLEHTFGRAAGRERHLHSCASSLLGRLQGTFQKSDTRGPKHTLSTPAANSAGTLLLKLANHLGDLAVPKHFHGQGTIIIKEPAVTRHLPIS